MSSHSDNYAHITIRQATVEDLSSVMATLLELEISPAELRFFYDSERAGDLIPDPTAIKTIHEWGFRISKTETYQPATREMRVKSPPVSTGTIATKVTIYFGPDDQSAQLNLQGRFSLENGSNKREDGPTLTFLGGSSEIVRICQASGVTPVAIQTAIDIPALLALAKERRWSSRPFPPM